ncbi:ankyrin repeat domain-containing protein [Polaribacter ponticola]|uniref:Ankyrin repeat domain-containing protein n=1 Tax=Polaribacter ponticola TaxID=2978475 RepID=A0ABT5S8I0_9FLAO|nr:ankyrin repeat domain-containing protein [Polaribacter sp. MSW5]MDD7914427.1 ankyrin repeat domain-containing protein [Polaribacter sp. MSW5]
MKLPKMNSIKMLVSFSLSIILLASSCAQSNKNKNTDTEKSTTVKEKVETPTIGIHAAVMSNNLEAVKQHIAAGTDINIKDQMSGSTPLISAATFGKTTIVKALIDGKADLSIKNNDGSTALHTAAFFCHVEIVQLFIDAKADKSIKNNFQATARESILAPFEQMKPVYKMLQQQLSPLGLKIDLAEIEKNRPVIAMMLQ